MGGGQTVELGYLGLEVFDLGNEFGVLFQEIVDLEISVLRIYSGDTNQVN